MIIYLSGPDTFRSRERLKQLKQAFVKKYDPSAMNVVTLDGSGLKFETFQERVMSQGMLSSRRFIIVERPFQADGKTQEAIAEFITAKAIPEQNIVVFWNGEEAGTRKKKDQGETSTLVQVLSRVKQHEVFELLGPTEVEQWISRRVKQQGGSIDRAAAERLASSTGSDLWTAANEIEKLIHLKNGAAITEADVESSISEKVETNIFSFTDALSRKDPVAALSLLEEQFSSGSNELYLVTMIARQIRILIGVADIAADEPNPTTIASRLKLHPFVVKKALQQVRTFSQSELLKAHDAIVDIDMRIKNSRANPRALLELFVLKLCSS